MRSLTGSLLLIFPLFLGAVEPANAPKNRDLVLGFADCEPAVFTRLVAPVTVRLTDITYAPTSRLAGFKQEVVGTAGQVQAVTVRIDGEKWNGLCESLVYTAELAGGRKSSPGYGSWSGKDAEGMIAFSPVEPGGVVLGGSGTLEGGVETRFKYDKSGRRLLDTQTFALRGTSYVLEYSDYQYGIVQVGQHKITKLLGYTASLTVKR